MDGLAEGEKVWKALTQQGLKMSRMEMVDFRETAPLHLLLLSTKLQCRMLFRWRRAGRGEKGDEILLLLQKSTIATKPRLTPRKEKTKKLDGEREKRNFSCWNEHHHDLPFTTRLLQNRKYGTTHTMHCSVDMDGLQPDRAE